MFDTILYGFLAGILLTILVRLIATVVMMWKLNGIVMLPHLVVLFLMLLFASCEVDPIITDICQDGDCDAYFSIDGQQDVNGYYHVKLNWNTLHYPRFNIDIEADNTNQVWWIDSKPVIVGNFTSNTSWKFQGEYINLVDESRIYFRENKSGKLRSRRIVGPFPPSVQNDTIEIIGSIFWDAREFSKRKEYILKFILE